MKIVCSMTTMPNRINLIKPVLDAVFNQSIKIQHVEINVPYKCIRTGEDYIIPEWLENYPKVHIYRTEDYGSITKIAPTLLRYKDDKETYLWSVDDDIKYTNIILGNLIKYHDPSIKRILANSVAGINKSGFYGCNKKNTYDMMLEGFGTVLYPPSCVKEDFLSYIEKTSEIPDCRVSDDVVLSNYIHGQGILIFCCANRDQNIKFHNDVLPYHADATATHLQSGGHDKRYVRVIYHLKDLGMLYWTGQFPPRRNMIIKRVKFSETKSLEVKLPEPKYSEVKIPPLKKEIFNFALTCSSQKSGKRFWG
jgi:hypothetical protein